MKGGPRKGAGRKAGSTTTDNVKMGISISRENAEWLRGEKKRGKDISRLIDMAVSAWRGDGIYYRIHFKDSQEG